MTQFRPVPVQDVEPGDIVARHGYLWLVKENVFDPHGNTGDQPRHLLRCDQVKRSVDDQMLPSTYARDMVMGYLVGAPVEVQVNYWIKAPERSWPASSAQILRYFSVRRIPAEGLRSRRIQGITVWAEPLRGEPPAHGKRHTHRLLAKCPICGKTVSAGRLSQHSTVHRFSNPLNERS